VKVSKRKLKRHLLADHTAHSTLYNTRLRFLEKKLCDTNADCNYSKVE